MRVLGIKRHIEGIEPASLHLDELHTLANLHDVLPRSEFLVLTTPHTPETEGMLGRAELEMLPKGAVLVNLGRGILVDESALVEVLRSGHLGGALFGCVRERASSAGKPAMGRCPMFS